MPLCLVEAFYVDVYTLTQKIFYLVERIARCNASTRRQVGYVPAVSSCCFSNEGRIAFVF